jgi:zinc protease
LFSGLSATAWSQTVLVKSEKNIEEYKLDNGFRVILAPNDKENKVFVNTIYFTGSLNDPKAKVDWLIFGTFGI